LPIARPTLRYYLWPLTHVVGNGYTQRWHCPNGRRRGVGAVPCKAATDWCMPAGATTGAR
jgi:hypothetical protein